jgi:hypothetical protein
VISTVTLERASRPIARNTCCIAGAPEEFRHALGAAVSGAAVRGAVGGAPHQGDGLVDVEGLGDRFEMRHPRRRTPRCRDRVRGHDDHRRAGRASRMSAQQLEPRGAPGMRMSVIRTSGTAPQACERGLGGLEGARRHAVVAQRALQYPADGGVVVDQPDTKAAFMSQLPGAAAA